MVDRGEDHLELAIQDSQDRQYQQSLLSPNFFASSRVVLLPPASFYQQAPTTPAGSSFEAGKHEGSRLPQLEGLHDAELATSVTKHGFPQPIQHEDVPTPTVDSGVQVSESQLLTNTGHPCQLEVTNTITGRRKLDSHKRLDGLSPQLPSKGAMKTKSVGTKGSPSLEYRTKKNELHQSPKGLNQSPHDLLLLPEKQQVHCLEQPGQSKATLPTSEMISGKHPHHVPPHIPNHPIKVPVPQKPTRKKRSNHQKGHKKTQHLKDVRLKHDSLADVGFRPIPSHRKPEFQGPSDDLVYRKALEESIHLQERKFGKKLEYYNSHQQAGKMQRQPSPNLGSECSENAVSMHLQSRSPIVGGWPVPAFQATGQYADHAVVRPAPPISPRPPLHSFIGLQGTRPAIVQRPSQPAAPPAHWSSYDHSNPVTREGPNMDLPMQVNTPSFGQKPPMPVVREPPHVHLPMEPGSCTAQPTFRSLVPPPTLIGHTITVPKQLPVAIPQPEEREESRRQEVEIRIPDCWTNVDTSSHRPRTNGTPLPLPAGVLNDLTDSDKEVDATEDSVFKQVPATAPPPTARPKTLLPPPASGVSQATETSKHHPPQQASPSLLRLSSVGSVMNNLEDVSSSDEEDEEDDIRLKPVGVPFIPKSSSRPSSGRRPSNCSQSTYSLNSLPTPGTSRSPSPSPTPSRSPTPTSSGASGSAICLTDDKTFSGSSSPSPFPSYARGEPPSTPSNVTVHRLHECTPDIQGIPDVDLVQKSTDEGHFRGLTATGVEGSEVVREKPAKQPEPESRNDTTIALILQTEENEIAGLPPPHYPCQPPIPKPDEPSPPLECALDYEIARDLQLGYDKEVAQALQSAEKRSRVQRKDSDYSDAYHKGHPKPRKSTTDGKVHPTSNGPVYFGGSGHLLVDDGGEMNDPLSQERYRADVDEDRRRDEERRRALERRWGPPPPRAVPRVPRAIPTSTHKAEPTPSHREVPTPIPRAIPTPNPRTVTPTPRVVQRPPRAVPALVPSPVDLFRGGPGHQHVDMSYEALLELEDVTRGMDITTINRVSTLRMYKPRTPPPSDSATPEPIKEKCCICLQEFEEQQVLRSLPCFHSFHRTCIDQWLTRNKNCPVCMEDVLEQIKESVY